MPNYPEPARADGRLPAAELEGRRQGAIDRLTRAFAADLVSMDEYESRVARAQNARSATELEAALDGLPAESPGAAPAGPGAPSSPGPGSEPRLPNRIDPRLAGLENLACVMGDRRVAGDWLSGDQVAAFTLMGSTKIDLRDTALPPGKLKIDAFVLMGETRIIVPRGLPVKMNCFPFMGEAHASRDVERRVEPDRPYVEVNGFAMMGSLVVVAEDRDEAGVRDGRGGRHRP